MNKFIFFLVIGIGLSACNNTAKTTFNRKEILESLCSSAHGKTEVVKHFPQNFPEVLIERGESTVYTRDNSNNFEYIGMPVGGIGAGQLYLGGDGQLWFWDIFSLNHKMGQLKGEEAYRFPYQRSKPNEKGARAIEQGFSITVKTDDTTITKTLNRDGFQNIEFKGQYPIGFVDYSDAEIPVKVHLEAYSPFIPLDLDNSILPATIFDFALENTSDSSIEITLHAWMENAVLIGTCEKHKHMKGKRVNNIIKTAQNGLQIKYTVEDVSNSSKNQLDYGSMGLTLLGDQGTILSESPKELQLSLSDSSKLIARLDHTITIPAHKSEKSSAIISWYFPKTYATQNKWKAKKWAHEDHNHPGADTTRYYAQRFHDASHVANYVVSNYKKLSETTKLWHRTWYDSTLPYWFLDRTFGNTSILASSTISLVGDKLYYGTEGGNQGPGTCNHVYGYTQAPARLFPELEKSLCEQVNYVPVSKGGALKENGEVHFRWFNMGMAVDGQSGIIMKSYQLHQLSKDHVFLQKNYHSIKKIMNGLIEKNDQDHDGILTGAQHNTLDASWYGKVTWLSLYYTTALRAMSEMANDVGDKQYALFCTNTANKGREYIENRLFNGDYFIHEADSMHPESPGTYTGLEYSQLLGQSWAYQVGLGEVVDYDKAKIALESLWRYNFTTDVDTFRSIHPAGRWYAMPGEGGLIACTWPRGGSEVLAKGNPRFAAYNNECQNGYEYAASSLMMRHDMPYHALAHMWYMDQNRYHGSKRNPYCEIEWGLHYARSMASYGHLIAISGFEYHGPKGYIAFSPQITPHDFKCAFTASEAWGTFTQSRKGEEQINRISIAYGTIKLNEVKLEIDNPSTINKVETYINKNRIDCISKQEGKKLRFTFPSSLSLSANEILTCKIYQNN